MTASPQIVLSTDEIRDTKWEFYGALSVPLYVSIFSPYYTFGFTERYGLPIDILTTYEDRRIHWLVKANQFDAVAEKVLPTLLDERWDYYDRWQKELETLHLCKQKILRTKLEDVSDSEIRALMREYRETFGIPFITNNVVEPLSVYFQSHLKDMLVAEGISAEKASDLMDMYGQAAKPSYLKLCAEEYRNALTEDERAEVVRRYYYIYNDYQGVKSVSDEDVRELVDSTPYTWAAPMRTDGITEKAQALLSVMQIIATIQDVRKADFLEMVFIAHRFGAEFARRSGIEYRDVEYATWAEIEEGTIRAEELRVRRKPFVLYWTLDGVAVFEGNDATRIFHDIRTFVLHADSDAREVKGVCASKGKVQGRAVIVFDTKEFDKVQPGDVLITMMTRPEFLPVMHRAVAFVCDEGGLTSHAAIVAREMKKPCVVATRVGSRIFKDGDMVEVDADAGIVRKL